MKPQQSEINVDVKLDDPNASVPVYMTDGAAACDVTSCVNVDIPAGYNRLVDTGLKIAVPVGYECQVRPRSGLALNHGITVFNSPGTIDSDYRGRVMVLLRNSGFETYRVNVGDRIAQLVFSPVTKGNFNVVDQLSDTVRGEGGWGSTRGF